jgi:hypothetical protein
MVMLGGGDNGSSASNENDGEVSLWQSHAEDIGGEGGGTDSLLSSNKHNVFMSFLGKCVFRNDPRWTAQAIGRDLAVVKHQHFPPHSSPSPSSPLSVPASACGSVLLQPREREHERPDRPGLPQRDAPTAVAAAEAEATNCYGH